ITPPPSIRGNEATIGFYQSLLTRLRALPGVEAATLMGNRIGSGWSNNTVAVVDGASPAAAGPTPMRWNSVGPDYFRALGTPILLGRDFRDADLQSSSPVAIVNETFTKRYLAGRPALGHRVALSTDPSSRQFEIVGVAANSHYTSVRETDRPMAYFLFSQVPGVSGMHVELRTAGDPAALAPLVRRAVQEIGPDLPLLNPMTQQQQFSRTYASERLFARLAAAFGVLAAVLVASGLYGSLSYRVSRRVPEIGIRMALGARRGQVMWMV